jgi:hypothetical protein
MTLVSKKKIMEAMEAISSDPYYEGVSVNQLNHIREKIELMSKFNQVEVLRILSKYNNIVLNENKYGIHVNLTDVPKEVVDKIKTFIEYVNTQENTLNVIEMQKEDFKNTYFTNDIKDNASKKSNPTKTNNKKR